LNLNRNQKRVRAGGGGKRHARETNRIREGDQRNVRKKRVKKGGQERTTNWETSKEDGKEQPVSAIQEDKGWANGERMGAAFHKGDFPRRG